MSDLLQEADIEGPWTENNLHPNNGFAEAQPDMES